MRVSQKIFLKNNEGKFLALRRSATDPSRPLTWDLPGGNIEEGEDLAESIKREVKEEVGLELISFSIFDAIGSTSKKGEYSIQIAYVGTVLDDAVTLSYEHDEYKWITKEEFLELDSTEKLKSFIEKLV
jgi:8-oxo-dGTP diphosphatase